MEEFPFAHPKITFFIGPFPKSDRNPFSRGTDFSCLFSSAGPRSWLPHVASIPLGTLRTFPGTWCPQTPCMVQLEALCTFLKNAQNLFAIWKEIMLYLIGINLLNIWAHIKVYIKLALNKYLCVVNIVKASFAFVILILKC